MSTPVTSSYTLNSQAAGAPIVILPPRQGGFWSGGFQQPGIIVALSSGASLTYNVEVTGDDTQIPTYVLANGVWVPFTGMAGLTASALGTLGAMVRAIRLNVTGYVSGSAKIQVVQLSPTGA